MAWWKKGLIYLSVGIVLIGIGFGSAIAIFGGESADLRARIEHITQQYNEAAAAQREANATIERLQRGNAESAATIKRLELTVSGLRDRSRQLENAITAITTGLDDIGGTTEESRRLIQESLRLLHIISERSGQAD